MIYIKRFSVIFLSFILFFLFFLIVQNYLDNSGKKTVSSSEAVYFPDKSTEKKEIFEDDFLKTAKLLFWGDLMLDRYNLALMEKNGTEWFIRGMEDLFLDKDLNILNLEGTITDKESVSIGTNEDEREHFLFTFDPQKSKNFLTNNKIGIVNLGNNHSLDFGKDGLEQTKNNLKNFKVQYFGDPTDENNFLIQEINGLRIGFISYNQFSKINQKQTIDNIKRTREEVDFVVVYTHWGQEYQLSENEKQRELAHQFIDNGADLIIGTHPHVVQPLEIYKNKVIFYSLGNFIFDQYFSEDVKNRLAVAVSISKDETEFYLLPIYTQPNGQIILADETKREALLSRISQNIEDSKDLKKRIKSGHFSIKNN
jgi:gamma-polyglutamate biosynthesis protein CapA